jgi:hypothetical protein
VPRRLRRQIAPARPIKASSAMQWNHNPESRRKIIQGIIAARLRPRTDVLPRDKKQLTRFVNFIETPPPTATPDPTSACHRSNRAPRQRPEPKR